MLRSLIFTLALVALAQLFCSCQNQESLSALSISEDGRYLVTKDGNAFLWLGDTAWELFHVLDREEATDYLDNRAGRGFSVIQAVALAELNGTTTPNAYGEVAIFDNDLSRINERYFDHVEWIINEATARGLYVAFLPTWGDKVANIYKNDRPIFTPESAFAYGKYLSDRFAQYPIIWVLGGDRNIISEEVNAIWMGLKGGIKAGKGGDKLMTYHPQGNTSSAKWFHSDEWLSFNAYQSGHAMHFDPVYRYCREHDTLTPRKPYINMEPCYEGIPLHFWLYRDPEARGLKREDYIAEDGLVIEPELYAEGIFNAYDVRVSAYWTLLSGAAGYTYGNNAVWQMFKPYGQANVPPIDYWYNVLDSEGAKSIGYVGQIFREYPLDSFRSAQELVVGENPEDSGYIAAAKGVNSDFALIYLAKGREFTLDCSQLELEGYATWFNPSNGERQRGECDNNDGITTFSAPSNEDWLLIIK